LLTFNFFCRRMMNPRGLFILSLIAIATTFSHAIYPDDHWDYSIKLTTSNFHSTIETAIGADKTVFVRWIASSG